MAVLVVGAITVTAVDSSDPASAVAAADSRTIGDAPIALNQPTDPEMGVLKPNADAAARGMFGSQVPWSVIPLHTAVARNGHLVSFGTPQNSPGQSAQAYDDWDPSLGFGTDAHSVAQAMHSYDSFCTSLVELADGRMVMVGGNSLMNTMIYDPTTADQTMGADLAYARWYSTALRLTDGRILVVGGGTNGAGVSYQNPTDQSQVSPTPEIGDPVGGWAKLTGATSTDLFGAEANRWWYPRAFNGPDGNVVGLSRDRIWSMSTTGAGTVQQTGTLPFDPGVSGSQVMFAPGKVLVAGGGQTVNNDAVPATSAAAIVDFNGATPTVASTAAMGAARNWLNLTVLPTGDVLANGGTGIGTAGGDANSVKQAEIWNQGSGTWSPAAVAQRTRTYHSVSVLMPSGAVFTGGGGGSTYTGNDTVYGPENNLNAELYYPASLFTKGADGVTRWASRPAISTISGSATYGGDIDLTIADGRAIGAASLITLPSVTHSQDTDQRRIPLTITQQGDTVTAALPASLNTMPPGDYELTVVDAKGVPSAAQIITIRSGQPGLVTVAEASNKPVDPAPVAGAPAPTAGTGTAPGAGTGTGTTPGAGASAEGSTVKAVTLKAGRVIGLQPAKKVGSRVSHSASKVTVRKAGKKSSRTVRRATSFVVRHGLGSKKGYSFESVDKPGWYLAAPTHGSGTVTLVKKSSSAAFKKRATFSSVRGVLGHDVSFRLTSTPKLYLRTDGSRLVVHRISTASSDLRTATFVVKSGLTKR